MKVITAIGNPQINERLKKECKFEVIGRDIQYQEGIIEILEERNDIEGILLSNTLIEEFEFNLLILKILEINAKIEIIVFLKEKDEEVERFLNSKKIYTIYYLNNYELFFENLNNKKTSNSDISKNIEDFKKIIYEEKNMNKINNYIKKKNQAFNFNKINLDDSEKEEKNVEIHQDEYRKEDCFMEKIPKNSIISFSGPYGVGKSIISILFAKYLSKKSKVLLIDCDFFNKSINTMLGISKLPKNYNMENLLNIIIKYKENLFILSSLELFNNNFENDNYYFLIQCLEKLKREFDFIIIDTSSNIFENKNNILFSLSSKIVFLIEPNLSEVKKANFYIEKIIKDYGIEENKINIIFNKVNKYKINSKVLNEIYSEKNIVGEIEYNEKFNLIINKNIFKDENIYEKVFESILK